MSCVINNVSTLNKSEVKQNSIENKCTNCVDVLASEEISSKLISVNNVLEDKDKATIISEAFIEKLDDVKGKNKNLSQIDNIQRTDSNIPISNRNTIEQSEISKFNSDSSDFSDDDDEKNSITLDDKYFKDQMLKNISKEYENSQFSEDLILEHTNKGERVELYYKDEGRKHFFCTEIEGKKIELNVVEASKLFKYGLNELKLILKKMIQCYICKNKYPMYNSFNYGNYYLCLNCSCRDQFINLKKTLFVDPLIYEEKFSKYTGIFIKCRKHKNYSPLSRFISITKRNKYRFHKECHDCILRYKTRVKMIKNIKGQTKQKKTRKMKL